MKFDPELNRRLIVATAETVIAHADELSELDRTIGDGDHGTNMDRGMKKAMEKDPQKVRSWIAADPNIDSSLAST